MTQTLYAIYDGHDEVTDFLVDRLILSDRTNDISFARVSELAFIGGNFELAREALFVQEIESRISRAPIDARDSDGRTLLMVAVTQDCQLCVNFLVGRGADVNVSAKDGTTPLSIAGYLDNSDIANALEKVGAKR